MVLFGSTSKLSSTYTKELLMSVESYKVICRDGTEIEYETLYESLVVFSRESRVIEANESVSLIYGGKIPFTLMTTRCTSGSVRSVSSVTNTRGVRVSYSTDDYTNYINELDELVYEFEHFRYSISRPDLDHLPSELIKDPSEVYGRTLEELDRLVPRDVMRVVGRYTEVDLTITCVGDGKFEVSLGETVFRGDGALDVIRDTLKELRS